VIYQGNSIPLLVQVLLEIFLKRRTKKTGNVVLRRQVYKDERLRRDLLLSDLPRVYNLSIVQSHWMSFRKQFEVPAWIASQSYSHLGQELSSCLLRHSHK